MDLREAENNRKSTGKRQLRSPSCPTRTLINSFFYPLIGISSRIQKWTKTTYSCGPHADGIIRGSSKQNFITEGHTSDGSLVILQLLHLFAELLHVDY